MKIYILALFAVLTSTTDLNAQDLYLISCGGTHSSGSGGSVSWSIGEVVINTATSSGHHVTQGFHQGNIYVVGIESLAEIAISVYPNPTTESVTINIDEPVNVSIYDMSGRLVGTHALTDAINSIDVTSFSRGTYNMVFERKGSETRNVKLIVL
jgi:hypothetical protein